MRWSSWHYLHATNHTMRPIERRELSLASRRALWKRTGLCSDSESARDEWTRFRGTVDGKAIVDVLKTMSGPGERCFFCADSRGTDIDHYNPIASSFRLTFSWPNLLLVCAACNRAKSTQPPIRDGVRILLDPTRDDPWSHLVYVMPTGLLAPRFYGDSSVDRMGEITLEILDILNHEAITEGRRRAARRLTAAVRRVLTHGDTFDCRRDLLHAIEDDPYGLAQWFGMREGALEQPFPEFRINFPTLWRRYCSAAT
jgi:HNH endonuclease